MADQYLVEPDVKFIREIVGIGGRHAEKMLSVRILLGGLPHLAG